MSQQFDPSKYGATPVSQNTGFDPSKFGAVKVQTEPNLYEQLVSGVKNIGSRFGEKVGTAYQAQKAGEQSPISTGLQYFGAGAGAVNQAVGGVLSAVTPDVIERGIAKVGEYISKPIQATGEKLGESPLLQKIAMSKGGEALQRNVESIGEANTLAGTFLGGRITPSATKSLGNVAVKTAEAVDTGLSGAGRFAYSQASGLSPSSITDIVQNPSFFTSENLAKVSREELAKEVKTAIDTKIENLRSTGSGYETIRNSEARVFVEPETITNVFSKYGVDVTPNGDIRLSPESKPFSTADIASIKDFFKVYGEQELSANGFLNAREALSEMAKYGEGKTNNIKAFARDLRSAYDELGKTQITGLKELDAKYAPEVQILSKIKKDYLNADGTFKDNAVTKIANLGNRGRESVLARLKPLIPDIEERVRTVRVVEDIESAIGQKVGTYGRAAVTGGAALSGNIPLAIAGIILAYPKSSIAILRSIGYTREAIKKGVNVARKWSQDVSNPKTQRLGELLKEEGKKSVAKWKETNKK